MKYFLECKKCYISKFKKKLLLQLSHIMRSIIEEVNIDNNEKQIVIPIFNPKILWISYRSFIEKLPIYIPDASDKEKYPLTQKIEELVKQILILRKSSKTADAEFLESKID